MPLPAFLLAFTLPAPVREPAMARARKTGPRRWPASTLLGRELLGLTGLLVCIGGWAYVLSRIA